VLLEGQADLMHDVGEDDVWRDLYRRIAGAVVKTWRMPVKGEEQDGIWHRRYYGAATKLARKERS
jgi:hypothetical protein